MAFQIWKGNEGETPDVRLLITNNRNEARDVAEAARARGVYVVTVNDANGRIVRTLGVAPHLVWPEDFRRRRELDVRVAVATIQGPSVPEGRWLPAELFEIRVVPGGTSVDLKFRHREDDGS